jgi:hypothetical protein
MELCGLSEDDVVQKFRKYAGLDSKFEGEAG